MSSYLAIMKIYSHGGEEFRQQCPELYDEGVDLIAVNDRDRTLDPDQLELSPGDLAFAPLYLLPFYVKSHLWVIAALLERTSHGIGIDRTLSTQGNPLWLPDGAQINDNSPVIEAQVKALRPDVSFHPSGVDHNVDMKHYWPSVDHDKIHVIHPSELVPLPGSNTMAIICLASDLVLRKRLMAYHHPEAALMTNIERKIGQKLSKNSGDVAVSCSKDNAGRFHLHVKMLRHQTFHVYQTVQTTWAGLVDSAISHLSA